MLVASGNDLLDFLLELWFVLLAICGARCVAHGGAHCCFQFPCRVRWRTWAGGKGAQQTEWFERCLCNGLACGDSAHGGAHCRFQVPCCLRQACGAHGMAMKVHDRLSGAIDPCAIGLLPAAPLDSGEFHRVVLVKFLDQIS